MGRVRSRRGLRHWSRCRANRKDLDHFARTPTPARHDPRAARADGDRRGHGGRSRGDLPRARRQAALGRRARPRGGGLRRLRGDPAAARRPDHRAPRRGRHVLDHRHRRRARRHRRGAAAPARQHQLGLRQHGPVLVGHEPVASRHAPARRDGRARRSPARDARTRDADLRSRLRPRRQPVRPGAAHALLLGAEHVRARHQPPGPDGARDPARDAAPAHERRLRRAAHRRCPGLQVLQPRHRRGRVRRQLPAVDERRRAADRPARQEAVDDLRGRPPVAARGLGERVHLPGRDRRAAGRLAVGPADLRPQHADGRGLLAREVLARRADRDPRRALDLGLREPRHPCAGARRSTPTRR